MKHFRTQKRNKLVVSSQIHQGFLISFLGLFLLFGQVIFAKQVTPFNDISKKVERVRESVENIYYELLKNHYFDDVNNTENLYANNLIISTNLDNDPVNTGTILLNLIFWLEKKNDRDSRFLLRKINRLYHLEFHRTLSLMELKKATYKDSLLSSFHDLSNYKVFHPAIGVRHPFGTSITKAILTLFIINKTAIPFDQKKESVFYTLEKIRQEIITINNELGNEKIDEKLIRSFIFGLEQCGIKETLVESKLFRNLLIASCITLTIGFVVFRWDIIGVNLNKFGKKLGTGLNKLIDAAFQGFFEKTSQGLIDGALQHKKIEPLLEKAQELEAKLRQLEKHLTGEENSVQKIVEKTLENSTRSMLRGLVRTERADNQAQQGLNENNQDPNNKNPDLEVFMEQLFKPIGQVIKNSQESTFIGRALFGRKKPENLPRNEQPEEEFAPGADDSDIDGDRRGWFW